jgi:hypothetical protein
MKKTSLSIREKIKPVVLYFDDVIYLVELFEEEAEKIEIKLQDKNSEYIFHSSGDLEELRNLDVKKFNNLEITSIELYININLYDSGGSIYISKDTPLLRGLMEKAKARLNPRSRKLFWLFNNMWLPLIASWYGIWRLMNENYFDFLVITLFSGIWFFLGHYVDVKEHTVVFTSTRNEMPSFFERKKDEIIIAFISALVGAGLVFIVSKLI